MEDGQYVDGSVYFYAPNKGAPIFFAVAFFASGVVHAVQCVRFHSWRLSGLYVFTAAVFAAAFAVRARGAFAYDDVGVFVATTCLTYAAPPLFELANYYVLGRVLYYVPHLSPLHPGRVLTTFTAVSLVVEVLNGLGAGMTANPQLPRARQQTGHALIKASLLLLLVVVLLFVWLAAVFHARVRRAGITSHRVAAALHTLYASEALLLARTIFRIVEYFSADQLHYLGSGDARAFPVILRYEWFFYVFEAAPMLANTLLLNARHPRRFLPQSTKVYLARDGVTEVVGPGYKEDRGFVATLLDPFDLAGLVQGRDRQTAFWEQAPPVPGQAPPAAAPRHGKRHWVMVACDPFDWIGKADRARAEAGKSVV